MTDGSEAQLCLRPVGDLCERFFVPRYQRGYRWSKEDVERLLDDVWLSGGSKYCLQPVVVKPRVNGAWELIDGQQRLTTIYLIFLYMHRARLQNVAAPYSIEYETREDSARYLNDLSPHLREENIDFFHVSEAYACITRWFERHGHRQQNVANQFYGYLFDSVFLIWYQASPDQDSTTLFTRLNVGRIPLTDAELFKAVLLSSVVRAGEPDRAREIAAQWDSIERDLSHPDVWAFVSDIHEEDPPTRITLLLDAVAGGPRGRSRPRFYTFETLRGALENKSPAELWNCILDLHARVMGWYENRSLYHKIGYLVTTHSASFSELIDRAAEQTKSGFERQLDELIRGSIELRESELNELSYETARGRAKLNDILLLVNVEAVRTLENSTERYLFRMHRDKIWSLEHIHAQNAEVLNKEEQWREWLRLHRDALSELGDDDPQQLVLAERIDAALQGPVYGPDFRSIAEDTNKFFAQSTSLGAAEVHSIRNLALLLRDDNSVLGNAVFEVKRRRVLELDKAGQYIPICTRRVFLKYYTDANAQQIHFWSVKDRESYYHALRNMLSPYLITGDQTVS